MKRPHLRCPRALLALAVAIVGFGVFSSGVGSGALPLTSLPKFGVTTGDGSLSTVAELGDINNDGFGDYAVGLPSADVGGDADAGIVYVFLGHGGALPTTPTAVNLANASFTISGHGSEMLGYTIVGNDVNGDHISDIAIGAPMAGAPGKSGAGALYVIFGHPGMTNISTTSLSAAALTTDPGNPTMAMGSRYDGFVGNAHTGMALAALPDVNGDGYNDLAVGSPDADLHLTGGGGVAVLYGQPKGVHITLFDLWEKAYPYFFHIDFPDRDDPATQHVAMVDQHAGMSVASVGDMTGDGLPDIAIGAPQADFNGTDSGSVWIISADIAPIVGCTKPVPPETMVAPGSVCPWIKLNNLQPGQGYRIDGAAAGDQLGTSLAGLNGQLAIGAAGASPNGRLGAGEVVVVPGQSNQATRNLAVTPPLQSIYGAEAGSGLGASLAAAGIIGGHSTVLAGAPGEASGAGAAYLLQIAPGTTSDLALATSKIAPAGAGSMAGSAVAAGLELHGAGAGADALIAAPGAGNGTWYVLGGTGTPILPPPPSPPAPPAPPPTPPPPPAGPPPPPATPPAPPATPPAPPATTTGGSTGTSVPAGTVTQAPSTTTKPLTGAKPVVKKKKKKLPLCPAKKPKPKYHVVKGKRVKVKPKPCRPRQKTAATA
jgi:FG-GAP repeat